MSTIRGNRDKITAGDLESPAETVKKHRELLQPKEVFVSIEYNLGRSFRDSTTGAAASDDETGTDEGRTDADNSTEAPC